MREHLIFMYVTKDVFKTVLTMFLAHVQFRITLTQTILVSLGCYCLPVEKLCNIHPYW